MTHRNRHNHNDTGFTFDRERFNKHFGLLRKIWKHPAATPVKTLLLGTTMLGLFAKSEISTQYQKFTGQKTEKSAQKFTAHDAVSATLMADYGEVYQVGKYPQLDIVADTAKSSHGLKDGIKKLLGEPLAVDTIYQKRILSDEKLFSELHDQALAGLYADVSKEAKSGASASNVSGEKILSPVRNPYITSKAGKRKRPGGVGSSNHAGVDFRGKAGTEVLAVTDGKVVQAFISRQSIGTVVVEGLDANGRSTGYRYHYLHVRPYAKVGTKLKAGDKVTTIARSKEYGNEPSTGDHLHFEIHKKTRFGWSKIEPAKLNQIAAASVPGRQNKQYRKNSLFNKFGEYVFNSLKKQPEGNVVATLYGENERLFSEKKISKAEYNKRQKGIEALGQELHRRGLQLYVKNKHEDVQKLAAYAVNLLDREQNSVTQPPYASYEKPAVEDNVVVAMADPNVHQWAQTPSYSVNLTAPALLGGQTAYYNDFRDNSVSLLQNKTPLRDKVADLRNAKNELVVSVMNSVTNKTPRKDVTDIYQRMIFAFGS